MRNLSRLRIPCIFRCILMPAVLLFSTVSAAKAYNCRFQKNDSTTILGQWDITVIVDGKKSPSWLEVTHSGLHMLVGRFVGISGSARPISRVNFKDGKISFSIPPQWEPEDKDLSVEGTLEGDNLAGSMTFSNGKIYNWPVRGPRLSGASHNRYGDNQFTYLMVQAWKAGTPRVRTNGRQKTAFCTALNPERILLPIKPLPILSCILNSVIRKAVIVACIFAAGMNCRL